MKMITKSHKLTENRKRHFKREQSPVTVQMTEEMIDKDLEAREVDISCLKLLSCHVLCTLSNTTADNRTGFTLTLIQL